MDAPVWLWFAVLGAVIAMLLVDLVAHRHAHVIGVREAAAWSVVWVACGVGFGGLVWWQFGAEPGHQYFAGYLIEKSLAVDNVFVWAIIFSYFAVPREYQPGKLAASSLRAVSKGAAQVKSSSPRLALSTSGLSMTSQPHRCQCECHRNDDQNECNARVVSCGAVRHAKAVFRRVTVSLHSYWWSRLRRRE